MKITDLPVYLGASLQALVVKNGGRLSSQLRRSICSEAKGTSDYYVTSAVYHDLPDSKRWVDSIKSVKEPITEDQFRDLNEVLGLSDNDAVFIGVKPQSFMVAFY